MLLTSHVDMVVIKNIPETNKILLESHDLESLTEQNTQKLKNLACDRSKRSFPNKVPNRINSAFVN